ncbi:MAG: long-chain-fatty-acid--CoA ligase [Rhodocyclaceae bacterium]|nr:long-chain-fatty-acid--CoA ligase [Rhodocyclaceae bacterium]
MERIWLASYPAGVPADIDATRFASLADLFVQSCDRFRTQTAYLSMGKAMSYGELADAAHAFAAWLQAQGVAKGDRVALMLPNVLQYPVALFGALLAGAVVVNCNPLYTPRELEHQLKDAGAETIVILENFAATLQAVIDKTTIRHVVVTSIGEMLGCKGMLVDFVVRRLKKLVPRWHLPGAVDFRSALAQGRRHGFAHVPLGHDDLAFLQYTGGTTGIAKGAMLTHGNVCANIMQAHAWVRQTLAEGKECILTALPLYHIFALTANCLVFLMLGARNLLIANPRDIPRLVKEWEKYPVSAITGVNTLFNALLNHERFHRLDFSTMKVALGGGMAVLAATAERWRKAVGVPLIQAYGLTEASPAVAVNPLDAQAFTGSVGLPLPSTEISIRADDGRELPVGEVGEICVRGPQVMKGYWRHPEETAAVFYPEGFLRTGDLGYVDGQGYLYLVDRKKDTILVSGFNVYPNEVEEVVAQHPGVLEVAAIGVPDEHSGEAVKIFVVRKDPNLTAEALIAHCKALLTGYKVPKHVEFRAELPKTNIGKVLRRALKARQE